MKTLLPLTAPVLFLLASCGNPPAPKKPKQDSEQRPQTASAPPALGTHSYPSTIDCGTEMNTALDEEHNFVFSALASLEMENTYRYCGLPFKGMSMEGELDPASYIVLTGPPDSVARVAAQRMLQQFGIRAAVTSIPDATLMSYGVIRKEALFDLPLDDAAMKFRGKKVDAFIAVGSTATPNPANQVLVRYYATGKELEYDQGDFIVQLLTKDKDEELIIACVRPEKTLQATYEKVSRLCSAPKVEQRAAAGKGANQRMITISFPRRLDIRGAFIAPDIDLQLATNAEQKIPASRRYPEGQQLAGQHNLLFHLDEKGAQMVDSLVMTDSLATFRLPDLYVNRPFLVYLKAKKAKQPYLLMWVNNPEIMPEVDKP